MRGFFYKTIIFIVMKTKLIITENQANVIIHHIKNEQLIQESWKDIVLGIAMLAGVGLTGQNKAQAQQALRDVNILQKVENVLQSEKLEQVIDSLEEAGMENAEERIYKNADKIEKNLEKASFKITKQEKGQGIKIHYGKEVLRDSVSTYDKLAKKLKAGWALSEIDIDTLQQITQDTVHGEAIFDTVAVPFAVGDLFGAGEFILDSDAANEVSSIIDDIKSQGYSIIGIKISSSTDKQRVSDKLSNKLIELGYDEGNKGLSKIRNDQIKKALINSNVPDSIIKQNIKWDQGRGEMGAATPQDPSARYVTLEIVAIKISDDAPEDRIIKTVEDVLTYNFEIAKVKGKSFVIKLPKINSSKKIKTGKCSPGQCPTF